MAANVARVLSIAPVTELAMPEPATPEPATPEPATVIDRTAQFLREYIALPDQSITVVSAWVAAAWLVDVWDKFPHLAITSPEKRCGKTTLLDLLYTIVPRPRYTSDISPAALYRVIEQECPTILYDEAQSLSRKTSESGNVNREILNASIGKNGAVTRCHRSKDDIEVVDFKIHCPKAFAMIGPLDSVLADRCLPVQMKRKTPSDIVSRYKSRIVQPRGKAIAEELEEWAAANADIASTLYGFEEPFDIENDRRAELLLPLQIVLLVAGCEDRLNVLREYAESLEERDEQQQSFNVQLLAACREIFEGETFIPTAALITSLNERDEEPWHRWNNGSGMSPEALAKLLRPYGITSQRDKKQTCRGYYRAAFEEAWSRYLPNPSATRLGPARR